MKNNFYSKIWGHLLSFKISESEIEILGIFILRTSRIKPQMESGWSDLNILLHKLLNLSQEMTFNGYLFSLKKLLHLKFGKTLNLI